MSLKSQLQSDLTEAMKARDEVKVATLRLLKAATMKFEVSGKEKVEATDDDVLKILKKEVKQRQDSIEQFEAGNRHDLAEIERKQLAVLEGYLPTQMNADELKAIVQAIITGTGTKSPSDMGKVMGLAMKKVAGQADGSMVREMVQKALTAL
ncbi:MAG: hypothetical protein UT55_C0021G0007 [Candidatus Peregrinibacteria bacterium GW2011_GWE2_39_6]|nr:MAG: hypothetical protein UT36_C0007G0042 [Candidatus Peregrinibacteria bacterium GW2011_GWF2_39_17]KKR26009.1 MAG: hypothetical protein UT55_C0021G0007 [Candidatus Peregrinibacteria bacterium GW2011_GWE2_39_6]HCW31891.1 glutamyl-tRNA amidotransferase [Candidatus Peregrinibacteria bacterium]